VIILRKDLLLNIFEVVTPVGVKVVASSSKPLFRSFGPRHWPSSEGFLATLTPEDSEDSILFLDFSSREPHNSPFLSWGIIASEPLDPEAEKVTEPPQTGFPLSPNQTSGENRATDPGRPEDLMLLIGISILMTNPSDLNSREGEVLRRGSQKLDVMNPGPRVVLEAWNPTDEDIGNVRNQTIEELEDLPIQNNLSVLALSV